MKISAVIITKNEARNIGRCLASLEGVADEIVVVDTFSEDGTQEIAKSHGARVIEKEWLGYSATKNFANDTAQHEYVLSLDADEALTDTLKQSILAIKQTGGAGKVYTFNRLAFYCDKPIRRAGWYPDTKPRLFPKGAAEWKGAYVHEELIPNEGVDVQWLEGDLLHYTYYTVEEHVERARKYAALAAQRIADAGKGNLQVRRIGSTVWRFIKMYLLKGGILEGWRGLAICRISALEVWWKYGGAMKIKREAADS